MTMGMSKHAHGVSSPQSSAIQSARSASRYPLSSGRALPLIMPAEHALIRRHAFLTPELKRAHSGSTDENSQLSANRGGLNPSTDPLLPTMMRRGFFGGPPARRLAFNEPLSKPRATCKTQSPTLPPSSDASRTSRPLQTPHRSLLAATGIDRSGHRPLWTPEGRRSAHGFSRIQPAGDAAAAPLGDLSCPARPPDVARAASIGRSRQLQLTAAPGALPALPVLPALQPLPSLAQPLPPLSSASGGAPSASPVAALSTCSERKPMEAAALPALEPPDPSRGGAHWAEPRAGCWTFVFCVGAVLRAIRRRSARDTRPIHPNTPALPIPSSQVPSGHYTARRAHRERAADTACNTPLSTRSTRVDSAWAIPARFEAGHADGDYAAAASASAGG